MGKVDYESEIFLIQRYITLWKGTTASVDIISLSSKLFHDSCFKPAERRKYFFRYSVNVGENSFDLKQVAIISAETCQMVLNLILASICIEKNWGDEKILVIPVTWQISAQPLQLGPQNGPPSGQTGTYRKTKGIQSYLRIWRSCHPIESGPSEPKKGWFHRCSVKKCRIFGQKCSFLAPNPFFFLPVQFFLSPPWRDTKKTTFFCWILCTGVHQKMARKSDFFTLHLYNPPFLVSDGPDSMGS